MYSKPKCRPAMHKILVPPAIIFTLSSQNRKISRVQFSKYWDIKLLIISRGKYHSTCTYVSEWNLCLVEEEHHKHPPTGAPWPLLLVDTEHTNDLPQADGMVEW